MMSDPYFPLPPPAPHYGPPPIERAVRAALFAEAARRSVRDYFANTRRDYDGIEKTLGGGG